MRSFQSWSTIFSNALTKNKRSYGICLLVLAIPLFSQGPHIQKPSFEVISIKPSAPASSFGGGGTDGDRYVMHGTTLKILLQIAYRTPAPDGAKDKALLRADQVLGGPSWIDSDHFDVEAKVGCAGGIVSDDEIQLMVQSMLEDRFQLRVHYEKRDLPVYDLVIAKGGPKLKLSQDQTRAVLPAELTTLPPCAAPPADKPAVPPVINSRAIPRGLLFVLKNISGVTLTGTAVPIAGLAGMLQGQAGRLVLDKTGLTELFDIDFRFSNPPSPPIAADAVPNSPGPAGAGRQPVVTESNVPELFTAIEEQLGLRLESGKAPLDVLVIDSVSRPSEN